MDGVDFTAAPPGQAGGGLACLPHSIGIYRLAPNEWDAPVCAGSRGFSVPLGIRLRTDNSGSLARVTRPFGWRGICYLRSPGFNRYAPQLPVLERAIAGRSTGGPWPHLDQGRSHDARPPGPWDRLQELR